MMTVLILLLTWTTLTAVWQAQRDRIQRALTTILAVLMGTLVLADRWVRAHPLPRPRWHASTLTGGDQVGIVPSEGGRHRLIQAPIHRRALTRVHTLVTRRA